MERTLDIPRGDSDEAAKEFVDKYKIWKEEICKDNELIKNQSNVTNQNVELPNDNWLGAI